MKNILLLGATGKTGIQVLNYAISKGYHVTALVRDPAKIALKSDRLCLVRGTPTSISDIRAVENYNAIISTLGHPSISEKKGSQDNIPPNLMTESMKNMVMVMKEKGIRRIVIQSGAGAGDSFSRMPLPLQKVIKSADLRSIYADHSGQEQVVMNSDLDWTVVRPVTMTDTEQNWNITVNDKVRQSSSVSRKTIAKFLVDCLETDEFTGKAVIIAENKTGHKSLKTEPKSPKT